MTNPRYASREGVAYSEPSVEDFALPFVPPPGARLDWEPTYGFTKTDRVALAAALEAVRRRICAYGPLAETCDCKYGLDEAVTSANPSPRVTHSGSEMTGCPELRSAIWTLLHGWPTVASRSAADTESGSAHTTDKITDKETATWGRVPCVMCPGVPLFDSASELAEHVAEDHDPPAAAGGSESNEGDPTA